MTYKWEMHTEVDAVLVNFYEKREFLEASFFQRHTKVQALFDFIGRSDCFLETETCSLADESKLTIGQAFGPVESVDLRIIPFDELEDTDSLPDIPPFIDLTESPEKGCQDAYIDLTICSPVKGDSLVTSEKDADPESSPYERLPVSHSKLGKRKIKYVPSSSPDENKSDGSLSDDSAISEKLFKRKRKVRRLPSFTTSSSDASDTTTSNDFLEIGGKLSLPHAVFNDTKIEEMTHVPKNINGKKRYRIRYEQDKKFECTKDCRPWGKLKLSKRAGFKGKRYIQDCKGYLQSENEDCPFLKEFKVKNKVNFSPIGINLLACEECGSTGVKYKCLARKIMEFNPRSNEVDVYHFGNHNCPLKKTALRKITQEEVEDVFKNDVIKKPSSAGSNIIKRALLDDQSWGDIENLAEGSLDSQFYRNTKKRVLSKLYPHGHSTEAVKKLKEKTEEKDKYLIFLVSDTTIFKTSSLKLEFAKEMARSQDNPLSKAYMFMDEKADRCKGYVTLTMSTYHPLMKQMVVLATMECPKENKEYVTKFLKIFNKAFEIKFQNKYKFEPMGFVFDEASSNWQAVEEIFGKDMVERSKSCDFHFMQSINRHKAKITTSDDDKEIFKTLAKDMMSSTMSQEYHEAKHAMECFLNSNQKLTFLHGWLDWWHHRRAHWAKAFRPDHYAPGANLAEVVNARFYNKGTVNLSLVAAALDDTVESVILEKRYIKLGENFKVAGSGASNVEVTQKEVNRQENFANQASMDLDYLFHSSENPTADSRKRSREEFNITEDCSFEPTPKRAKRQKTENGLELLYDKSKDNSSLNFDSLPSAVRPTRFRSKRNQQFNKSITFAKNCNLKLVDFYLFDGAIQFTLRNSRKEKIKVHLQAIPSCTCVFKTQNTKKVCMHIIFVLLKYCNVSENSMLLHQIGYTTTEVQRLRQIILDKSPKVEDDEQQNWILSVKKKLPGKTPHCSGCKEKAIEINDIHIYVSGKINLENGVETKATFRFCPNLSCLKNIPKRSNLSHFVFAYIDSGANISEEVINQISSSGIKLKLKINFGGVCRNKE